MDHFNYDADGQRDLLGWNAQGDVKVAILRPRGAMKEWLTSLHDPGFLSRPGSSCDISHLGAQDILGQKDGQLVMSRWKGEGFTVVQDTQVPATADVIVLDVDGDGQHDLLRGENMGEEYVVTWYRNMDSTDDSLHFAPGEVVERYRSQQHLHLSPAANLTSTGRAVWLMSGKTIQAALEFHSTPSKKLEHVLVQPAGLGLRPQQDAPTQIFADIDGDGLDDIVYADDNHRLNVQVNRDGFFAPPQDTGVDDMRVTPVALAASLVVDIDADGHDDVLFPARRVVDFCLQSETKQVLCSDGLQVAAPDMDVGIYEYDAIQFRLQANGRFKPVLRSDLGLIAQANRASADDLYGDGRPDVLSPFDGGVANG